ncbi:tail assembly protein [[Pasteurella] aerogenes]
MVNVKFYGNLKQFGTDFKLDVKDTAEAIRALCSQIKGFRQVLQQGYYKVRIGRDYLNPETLEKGLFYCLKDGQTVHFTPVIKGAKSGGVFQTILGVALIGVSFFIPAAGLLGNVITQAGVFGMGVALTLGGVSQMLTKTPEMGAVDDKEKKQSTSFSNLGNLVAQGRPVPLAYGQILTGSLVISQGVETFDVEEEMKNPKKQSKGFNKG